MSYQDHTPYGYPTEDDANSPFHHAGFGSGPAEQVAYAREELRDARVDENHYMDDYYLDTNNTVNINDQFEDHVSPHKLLAVRRTSLGFDGHDSRASIQSVEDSDDPALVFVTLEEVLPKTAAEATQQQQANSRDQIEHAWEIIRRWLWSHPSLEDRQAAAYVRGQADATSLHLMCKLHNPPEDIVLAMIECAPETVSWTDSHGWLPLHHACANGATPEVMKLLIDAYPAGKLQQDNQSRTPLHFYATRNSDTVSAMMLNAELLSDTGAAELADRGGMLPMHYACAYGTKPEVLYVLASVYPESLVAKENHGRTPMHLAMVNAHRDASPDTISFLLSYPDSKATINARDHDRYTPLHLLALGLKGYRAADMEKRVNVADSLALYLEAEPMATADFLTAIQDLPGWLLDTAVVTQHVRNVLNQKIVKRFPTSILIMDGYLLIILIVCFALTTKNHIDLRFDPENTTDDTQVALAILFAAVVYFFVREVIQIASLISLGSFNNWMKDLTNWIDVAAIIMVIYYAALMAQGSVAAISDESFRSGAAFTQGLLWVSIIMFLKKTLVDFAVFVGGVFYVVRRLAAFLIAVGVILLAFAQMFYFVYVFTPVCDSLDGSVCTFPHCTFQNSLLKVYTMMMGEVNTETRYSANLTAQCLYLVYGFLVIILLSNVLIAIVTDSYEIIQNDRAAIVFWCNRLDFCAEMDAITYAVKKRISCCFRTRNTSDTKSKSDTVESPSTYLREETPEEGDVEIFRESWQQVMALFDANAYDEVDMFTTLIYTVFRVICIVFIIPVWLAVGAATAGWLWPPQVREWLFVQKTTAVSRAEQERQKLARLKDIQNDLKHFKHEITKELAADRDDMVRMRNEVDAVQSELIADLQQVKELMGSLLGD